ncbi:MAG TPA: hypothetical protein VJ948_10755 [Acidimicrobiia bacterium]|nr:hypothetical protein [Acidimicrobiia bacterium]
MREAAAPPGTAATVIGVLGLVLYLATGFLYLTSGLVVPFPWLMILWLVWLAGIYPLVRIFQRRRAWTPLLAVAALAFWWIYLALGESLLGWTA